MRVSSCARWKEARLGNRLDDPLTALANAAAAVLAPPASSAAAPGKVGGRGGARCRGGAADAGGASSVAGVDKVSVCGAAGATVRSLRGQWVNAGEAVALITELRRLQV